MGLLNRYFSLPEKLAQDIVSEGTKHIDILRDYVASALQKRDVILSLTLANYSQQLPVLRRLLQNELVELGDMERTDAELVANLHAFHRDKAIKRAHRLDACLGYAEMKEEHVHYFLVQLYHTLRSEWTAVLLLEKGVGNAVEVIEKLKGLGDVEKALLDQMSTRDAAGNRVFVDASSFKGSVVDLFSQLVRGEHVIHGMDRRMRDLVREIMPQMREDPAAGTRGKLADFIEIIHQALNDRIHELVTNGEELHHVHIDFDVVNRPDFIELVRVKNAEQKAGLSENQLLAFVLIYRNWFNKWGLND